MQNYIQNVLGQIDELTEQQISAVVLFLAISGSSGGEEGRQMLESSFSCLPVSTCAKCIGSSMFCVLYLQVMKEIYI